MGDDSDTILGDLDVQLKRAHPQLHRVAERVQGALRPQAKPAAVGLQVELATRRRLRTRRPDHGKRYRQGRAKSGQ